MLNQKDIVANNIKILNNRDITIINNNDGEDYIFSALTVEGGGVFKKGLVIGIQERMIPGLIIYDNENFYGFSEKNGLSLLSTHQEYNELIIPSNIFDIKEDRIQPTNLNDTFKNLKETEKIENKNLNIDLQIKDTNNFYILIPKIYENTKFILTFDITYINDLNTIISNISFVLINKSDKLAYFKIKNENCYYSDNFTNEINKNSIIKLNLEVINEDHFIIDKKLFKSA
jgi:hypothetical protein